MKKLTTGRTKKVNAGLENSTGGAIKGTRYKGAKKGATAKKR